MKLVREAKIYPNKTQEKSLLEMLENGRVFYNQVLERKLDQFKETGENLHRFELQKIFNGSGSIPGSYRQVIIYRVDLAFKRFFKLKKGFPRFKSENRMRSIELRQSGKDYRVKDGKLNLWREIGSLRMRGFNGDDMKGMARIVKRASGWYFQYYVEVEEKKQRKTLRKRVGIDMGIKSFLADSDGETVVMPSFEVKNPTPRNYERMKNRRKDFLHKLSRKYAEKYDFVGVENLDIKKMIKNRRFSKGISHSAWGMFHNLLSYKLKMLGKVMVKVEPRGTSQTCLCGVSVKKDITVRVHDCPVCGLKEDRDIVSAKLIKRIAWDGHLALLAS